MIALRCAGSRKTAVSPLSSTSSARALNFQAAGFATYPSSMARLRAATTAAQRAINQPVSTGLPGHPLPQAPRSPDDSAPARFPFERRHIGYFDLVETRVAAGRFFNGPSAIWFRLNHPIVAGEVPSVYQRVAVAADSINGVSAVLDLRDFLFVNSDLTINLLRCPRGEWVCLAAHTLLGDEGSGLAESVLYDIGGVIGRATQSLFVRRREW